MKNVLEVSTDYKSYKDFKEPKGRFAYVVKFKGNKREEMSDFYMTKEIAVASVRLLLNKKANEKDHQYLKKAKSITFIYVEATGATDNGQLVVDTTDLETILFDSYNPKNK